MSNECFFSFLCSQGKKEVQTKLLRHDESILIRLEGYSRFMETTACGAQHQCLFHRRDKK